MSYISVVNEVFVKQQRGTRVVLDSFVPYNPNTDAPHFRRKQFFSNPEIGWFTNRTLVIGNAAVPPPPPPQSSDAFIGQDTFPFGWPEPDPPFIQAQRGFVNYWTVSFAYNSATDPTRFRPQAKVFEEMMIPEQFRVFIKPQIPLNPAILGSIAPAQAVVPDEIGVDQSQAVLDFALFGLGMVVTGSQYDDINPIGSISTQSPQGGELAFVGSNVLVTISLGPTPPPPYPGITLPDAIFIAINAGLVVGQPIVWQYDPVVPYNFVISQTPPAGSTIPQQSVVHFVASLGPNPFPAPGSITVPDFTNLMILDAQQQAIDLGLSRANRVLYAYSDVVPGGYVITQSLVPGSVVPAATAITFTVSVGTSVTTLPGAQIVTPVMH